MLLRPAGEISKSLAKRNSIPAAKELRNTNERELHISRRAKCWRQKIEEEIGKQFPGILSCENAEHWEKDGRKNLKKKEKLFKCYKITKFIDFDDLLDK